MLIKQNKSLITQEALITRKPPTYDHVINILISFQWDVVESITNPFQFEQLTASLDMGPSIYDIHTEGGQAQVDACGRGREGQAPCGRPHRKLKIESTDVILSSSHAKKLVSFLPESRLSTE